MIFKVFKPIPILAIALLALMSQTFMPAPAIAEIGDFACVYQHDGTDTVLTLSGSRANSEHLRVNGSWAANVTGIGTYTVSDVNATDVEVRLRGNGYDGPAGYQSVPCTPPTLSGDFWCTYQIQEADTILTFGGVRGQSEHLRVNGSWAANVTGLGTYTVSDVNATEVEVRLRGNGYDGPAGYQSTTCGPPETDPASGYLCAIEHSGNDTVLTFDGYRADSEHLQVDGSWAANVTGVGTYTVSGVHSTDVEVRLRGNGYDGPDGYLTVTCALQLVPLAPLEPANDVLFGAWPKSRATGVASSQEAVTEFEATTNTRLDIVQTFSPPQQPELNVEWANWVLSSGRIPLMTWKVGPDAWPSPGDNVAQRVINGEFDDQIRMRAAEANQIDGLWFSRLFHEMDGQYGVDYDMTPDRYSAYWQRIRRIFTEEGVTNAVWVWTPAAFSSGEEVWYPGDEHVDWIGVDPYLWIGDTGPSRCGTDSFQTLEQRIGEAFWDFTDQHPTKPIMLAEWGAGQRSNTDIRERFFESAQNAIDNHPKLKALVYFNSDPSGGCGWPLATSDTPTLAAYRNLTINN